MNEEYGCCCTPRRRRRGIQMNPCLLLQDATVDILSWSGVLLGKAWAAADAAGLLIPIQSWSDPATTLWVLPGSTDCDTNALVAIQSWVDPATTIYLKV